MLLFIRSKWFSFFFFRSFADAFLCSEAQMNAKECARFSFGCFKHSTTFDYIRQHSK